MVDPATHKVEVAFCRNDWSDKWQMSHTGKLKTLQVNGKCISRDDEAMGIRNLNP